jgi:hypothetical protein
VGEGHPLDAGLGGDPGDAAVSSLAASRLRKAPTAGFYGNLLLLSSPARFNGPRKGGKRFHK